MAVPQVVDRCIRSLSAYGLSPARIEQTLRLRRRYGISVRTIGRYVSRLSAAGSLRADGPVHRASRPHAADVGSTQRLLDTATFQSLQRLSHALQDPDLTPEQLSRLAGSLARHRQAIARGQAQAIANARRQQELRKFRLELKRKEAEWKADPPMTLEDKVRRIYGIEMPDCSSPGRTRELVQM